MDARISPIVSVVLGSYNRRAFLITALNSVYNNGISFPYEIIVVDGGSTDGSLKYLAAQKDVITIVQHNRGEFRGKKIERRNWGYFMNLGFKIAQGKYILMISDDSLLVPGAVKNGLERFERLLEEGRNIGAMAFYWRDWPDEAEYKVGLTLGDRMFVNHGLFLRQAVVDAGFIDEERYRFYHADGDLCLKIWNNGYEVMDAPDSYVEHFSHVNKNVRRSNLSSAEQDWQNYLAWWSGIFYDPEQPRSGAWEYKKYVDPNHTTGQFPRIPVLMRKIRIQLVRWKKRAQVVLFAKSNGN